ncbi:high-affinity lysophosphatidic acid receptor-like [Mya arenaria]|uniref:high-affinity lysophosphatidic acid receptor-like n=1 Tax=Mya arenaria TaxID=6604 RepID=UPI0022E1BAA7|nr:high-affinity lysophosphatidic acid receptor-like [Mya arenaria]
MSLGNLTSGADLYEASVNLSLGDRIILGTILLFTTCCSAVGNVFTCVIVYRKRPMRSAINLLLTNIACADLLLALTLMPFTLYQLAAPSSDVALNVCICLSVVKDSAVSVAACTLLVISMDRFLIIVFRRDRLSVLVAKCCMAVIWALSVSLASVQFLSNVEGFVVHDDFLCKDNRGYSKSSLAYTTSLVTLTFFLPMVVMFYLYATILRTVQLTSKKIHNHSGSTVNVSVTQYSSQLGLPPVAHPYRVNGDFDAKRRAFGTIIILYVTSLMCWLPYMAKRISINNNNNDESQSDPVNVFFLIIGCLKSALYPVFYCARNRRFRRACSGVLPSKPRLPKRTFRIKSRRVNPKVIYEMSEIETRT